MPRLIHLPGVAGCDEAGRGPLAGPVVCAAVVLPEVFRAKGLDDSKKVAPAARFELEGKIKAKATWAVVVVDVAEIDVLNILWASMVGMARALELLDTKPCRALIDGDKLPKDAPCPCEAVVDGDAKHACIAAASILAKTARDRLMVELHDWYPDYGFDHNFGYATPDHLEALKRHGPCPIHRRTFSPVADMLNQPCFDFDVPTVTTVEAQSGS